MTSEFFVFHCTPVVSDTTPVAMAPLQPEGNGGVSLPLPPANWELRYFGFCLTLGPVVLRALLHCDFLLAKRAWGFVALRSDLGFILHKMKLGAQ